MSGKDVDSRCYEGDDAQSDLVTLVDDEGNEHDFLIEDIFEYRDKRYAVLVPSLGSFDEGEGEGEETGEEGDWEDEQELEAYIFRIDEVGGEEVLVEVEDEEEWEQATAHWEVLKQDQDQSWDPDLRDAEGFSLDEDEDLN